MRVLFAALAVVVASGVHHTAAGNALARSALLRHADLGARWTTGATPKKTGSLACAAVTLKGVAETGAAFSPTFRRSSSGPFVSESVFAYNTARGAAAFFRQVATRTALSCLAQTVLRGGPSGSVAFTVTKREVLPKPQVSAQAAAFRVVGRAKAPSQVVNVYIDLVLLQRENEIAELSFSSFATPLAAWTEQQIARAAAKRL